MRGRPPVDRGELTADATRLPQQQRSVLMVSDPWLALHFPKPPSALKNPSIGQTLWIDRMRYLTSQADDAPSWDVAFTGILERRCVEHRLRSIRGRGTAAAHWALSPAACRPHPEISEPHRASARHRPRGDPPSRQGRNQQVVATLFVDMIVDTSSNAQRLQLARQAVHPALGAAALGRVDRRVRVTQQLVAGLHAVEGPIANRHYASKSVR